MNNRTLAKPKNQNSTTFLPVFDEKLSGRTLTPEPANETRDSSNLEFGHNFGDVQVESPSFKQSCPLALSGPAFCPFGDACHSCSPSIQAKLKINRPGEESQQSRTGRNYGDVRVHSGAQAVTTARSNVQTAPTNKFLRRQRAVPEAAPARGVTQNKQITFSGTPSPHLLGHELVHVVQQHLGLTHTAAASRTTLETEAHHIGSSLASGENVLVRHAASPTLALYGTDPDKTYTSTVGMETGDKYIAGAHEFHQKWGYNPINVASIEAISADLAKGSGTLDRIRIVSHASQNNLYLQFAAGSPAAVLEEELFATTQKEAEQAGVEITAVYADSASQEHFRDQVVKTESALAGRLGISKAKIAQPEVEQLFRWLLNRHRATGVPGVSQAGRALIIPAIDKLLRAARLVAEATQGINKADVAQLETIVTSVGFTWGAMTAGDSLQETFDRATATHTAYASRDFGKKQAALKKRFTDKSTIEIRGCALGQTQSYMEAVQEFFGGSQGKPAVHAPRMYQYYGKIGLYNVKNTDRHIKYHWEKWKDHADLQANFKKWAPVYAPSQKITKTPTWSDFATYLRAGHALPIKHGSRLFTLKNMTEDQVIDWFTKNDQRLTAKAAIQNQFTGSKLSEEATKRFLFEWLQDQYTDNPTTRIFPYDPTWSAQFATVAGKAAGP